MSSRGTWPQIASMGACDFFASYRPLSRWMEPGPTVPMQTPSRPLSCAWAPAANAATSSWRTPIHSMRSSRRIASVTGLSASPTTPQTCVTPWSARASMSSSATVVMGTSYPAGPRSALAARGRDPLDDLLLADQEDDDHRQRRDHARGDQDLPVPLAAEP